MGERKVVNKYYPPDFDPAKIPRLKRPKNQQMKVRNMLYATIRCTSCGNYMFKGTKYNCRKEDVIGEDYLGIKLIRFYLKCAHCAAELTIRTDPRTSGYVVETGATASKNIESWRENRENLDREMGSDPMESLEDRALESKKEMDVVAALEEVKSMKSRHAGISTESLLGALQRSAAEKDKRLELQEDEVIIKSVAFRNSDDFVSRIYDDEDEDELEGLGKTQFKRQKTGREASCATDWLIIHDDERSIANSAYVKYTVVQKKRSSSPLKTETRSVKEYANKDSRLKKSFLFSLCEYSDSEDDDDSS